MCVHSNPDIRGIILFQNLCRAIETFEAELFVGSVTNTCVKDLLTSDTPSVARTHAYMHSSRAILFVLLYRLVDVGVWVKYETLPAVSIRRSHGPVIDIPVCDMCRGFVVLYSSF